MPLNLTCPGCQATLRVREDLAGKKIKCPRCATLFPVPDGGKDSAKRAPDEGIRRAGPPSSKKSAPRRRPEHEEGIRHDPVPPSRRKGRDEDEEDEPRSRRRVRDEDEEDEGPRSRRRVRDEAEEEPRGRRGGRAEDEDEEDEPKARRRGREEEEEDEGRPRPKFKPCPRCGARGAKRVLWTAWGSFYGPAMFTHVRCPECGYAYNGRTGRSNLIPAIIFVAVPSVGILGIVAVVFFLVGKSQGWW